jgi:uncharacterized protein
MRVVLDTNVILSAILFGGKPRQIIEAALAGTIRIYASEPIISELKSVLGRPKFGLDPQMIESIVVEFSSLVEWVQPRTHVDVVKEDPSDNRVLDCALEAEAEYVISGDDHLLQLERCGKILILNPANFLRAREKDT